MPQRTSSAEPVRGGKEGALAEQRAEMPQPDGEAVLSQ
jgi:hypothetical protein